MFEKGKSGNPKGRPKGYKLARTKILEILDLDSPPLVKKAFWMAMNEGNEVIMTALLNKVLPNMPKDSFMNIEKLKGTLQEKGEQVVEYMSECAISPSEATSMMNVLHKQSELNDIAEIKEQLKMLIEAVGINKK